jgi:hypothetical protein
VPIPDSLRGDRPAHYGRVLPFALAAPGEPVTITSNVPSSSVRVMQWPARTCAACCHADCLRRRRERLAPCVVCDARILDGQFYRVLSTVEGEIVSVVHIACERRRFDR